RGRPLPDEGLLLLVNAHHEPVPFMLPDSTDAPQWEVLIDTAAPERGGVLYLDDEVYQVQGHALVLLRQGGSTVSAEAEAAPAAASVPVATCPVVDLVATDNLSGPLSPVTGCGRVPKPCG